MLFVGRMVVPVKDSWLNAFPDIALVVLPEPACVAGGEWRGGRVTAPK